MRPFEPRYSQQRAGRCRVWGRGCTFVVGTGWVASDIYIYIYIYIYMYIYIYRERERERERESERERNSERARERERGRTFIVGTGWVTRGPCGIARPCW